MSPNPRKRPAPGASPAISFAQMQPPFSPVQGDSMLRWSGAADASNYIDAAPRVMTPYSPMPTQDQFVPAQGIQTPSTALARRGINQALVPAGPRPGFDANSDLWNGFGENGSFLPTPGATVDENDSVERLEDLAQRAKRDAQAKRKQIPPFVQKLSSFLDESRNTDLIRWSDKGDSFIVLDEDEFAKTLIPELFKHNNYASFVRQLNMYGFHKRVGLSDNSMKASERKNKSPSEYYNPYFRRGHPNLLWLINKPKSGNSKKKGKKEEGDMDSDEEAVPPEEPFPSPSYVNTQVTGRVPANNEVVPLQRRDLVQIKAQLEKLQQQQGAISDLLQKLRRDHYALAQQAVQFQSQHNRHEQSINAILTFLANVFRKSLEEQGGAQSVQELLANLMPGAQGPSGNQVPQGSVVDLGDFFNSQAAAGLAVSPPKRAQRLLPPIPQQRGEASTVSPSPAAPLPYPDGAGSVTELFETSPVDTTSSAYIHNELQNNPQEGMMKIIQDTNAGKLPKTPNSPPLSLTNDQRNNVINMMAARTAAPSAAPVTASAPPVPPLSPTTMASLAHASTALSPIMSSVPPPTLHDLALTQNEIDALQRLQEEQTSKIDEISHLLGPLSPLGRIPGLDGDSGPFDNVDLDQFINQNAYSDFNYDTGSFGGGGSGGGGGVGGIPSNTDVTDFSFGLDGANDYINGPGSGSAVAGSAGGFTAGRVFETTSPTTNTSSPTETEVTSNNDLDRPERDLKRRRRD